MVFISLKDFSSIWYFKLIGLIGPRAVSERANRSSVALMLSKYCKNCTPYFIKNGSITLSAFEISPELTHVFK